MHSVGPVLQGIAPPIADTNDWETMLWGCEKRFLARPPPVAHDVLCEFEDFVSAELQRMFVPLTLCQIPTQSEWLEKSNYSGPRRRELEKAGTEALGETWYEDEYVLLNGFGKRETYLQYKPPRGINSRSDEFKLWAGPLISAIEKVVYSHPEFIKHVPVKDRPAYIRDFLGDNPGPYYVSDFSHFESHFIPKMQRACEGQLYEYMLQNTGYGRTYARILQGTNTIRYKNFTISVEGIRMSGEMSTSLGNGFSNLMIWRFLAHKHGLKVKGVVEGDDGLFAQCGGDRVLTSDDFKELGFEVKIEVHQDLLTASFCGISMSEDMCSLTDPRKVLLNFGWSHSPSAGPSPRVRKGLLKAKAISLLYEHPRCPILSKLAFRVCQCESAIKPRFDCNWYERTLADEAIAYSGWAFDEYKKGVSELARTKFEALYGISVETQLELESLLDSYREGPLPEEFSSLFGPEYDDCRDYYRRFVVNYGVYIG